MFTQELLDQHFISQTQIARKYGIPVPTAQWHLMRSRLDFMMIGGHRVYNPADVDAYIQKARAQGMLKEPANGNTR